MADDAHNWTDEQLKALEEQIQDVYRQAAYEMQDTINEFFESCEEIDKKQQQAVKDGKITEQEYKDWRETTMLRGQRYQTMQSDLANEIFHANERAMAYVNDYTPSIYELNKNFENRTIRAIGGQGDQVSFNIYDAQAVRDLIVNMDAWGNGLMPYYPDSVAVNRGIDLEYSKKQIKANILSGILQGKSIDRLATDLQKRLETMGRTSAVRTARTAFTSAENGGRWASFQRAKEMGIDIQKEWMATNDSRTRKAHRDADGQVVGIDDFFMVDGERLMFPGDSNNGATGKNLYNCRCTMVANFDNVLELEQEPEYETIIGADGKEYIKVDDEEYFRDAVDEWLKELTPEERNAINEYTENMFEDINDSLRGQIDSSDFIDEYIKNIQTALSKFKLKDNIVVYRKTSDHVAGMMNEGDVFVDDGFMSTSISPALRGFGQNVLEIHVPAGSNIGAYISEISDFSPEYEFLLLNGSGIQIETKMIDSGGAMHAVGKLIT